MKNKQTPLGLTYTNVPLASAIRKFNVTNSSKTPTKWCTITLQNLEANTKEVYKYKGGNWKLHFTGPLLQENNNAY